MPLSLASMGNSHRTGPLRQHMIDGMRMRELSPKARSRIG
jgi:hypothetical protein